MKSYLILFLLFCFYSCSNSKINSYDELKLQSLDEDVINQKDLFQSKINYLVEGLQDKTNPDKVQKLKVKLKLIFKNINLIIEQQYLLEKLVYNCIKLNGENLKNRHLLLSKYKYEAFDNIPNQVQISLNSLEYSDYNYSKLQNDAFNSEVRKQLAKTQIINRIKEIFKSNFKSKIQTIEASDFTIFINGFDLNSATTFELLQKCKLINYNLFLILNAYVSNEMIEYEEFLVNVNKVDLLYEIPAKIHLNEKYTVKVSFCAIDTISKHEFYFENKRIDSVYNNQAVFSVKAKSNDQDYQLLKGRVKFLTTDGEVRWISWSKKVKILK